MASYLEALTADRERMRRALMGQIEEEAAAIRQLQESLEQYGAMLDQKIVRLMIFRGIFGPSQQETLSAQVDVEEAEQTAHDGPRGPGPPSEGVAGAPGGATPPPADRLDGRQRYPDRRSQTHRRGPPRGIAPASLGAAAVTERRAPPSVTLLAAIAQRPEYRSGAGTQLARQPLHRVAPATAATASHARW